MKDLAARENIDELCSRPDRCRRHIFEFESDYIDALGKNPDLVKVVVGRLGLDVRNLPGRRIAVRRKGVHAVAHLAGLNGEHTPELAAAENTDG